jgi:hypothetical protein
MGAIENILPNAEARLIAGAGITSRWNANNVRQVQQSSQDWPPTQYACRLSLISGPSTLSTLIRGTLRVDIGYWGTESQEADEGPLHAALLGEVTLTTRALNWSWLDGALEEPLDLQTIASPRPVDREGGRGVACFADFSWGVQIPYTYSPPSDDGAGLDRGGAP